MFGESSMKSGASLTSPMRRASFVQSSSESCPERRWCSGTRASAERSLIVISILLISRLKMVEVDEASRDAAHHAAVGADGLDLVHRRLEQFFEDGVVLAGTALRDLVDGL